MRWGKVLVSVAAIALLGGCSPATAAPERTPGADPSSEAVIAATLACMQEAGFDVEIDEDGNIAGKIAEDQRDVAREAHLRCQEESGVWMGTSEDFSEADWKRLYEQTVDTYECLTAAGIEIEVPPTEQVFRDQYDEKPYVPFEFVPETADFAELESMCPQPSIF